jgi:glycosyltransferase involved in cell wall biosynthesis
VNILILTSMQWGSLWQRPHQIALRLANKGHNVIYFHSPISLNPSTFKRLCKEKNLFISKSITKKLRVTNLFIPPFRGKLGVFTEKLASSLFITYLKCFSFRPDVIFFYNPRDVFLLKYSQSMGAKVIYDCVDEFSAFPGVTSAHSVVKAEKQLFNQSSFVIAVSKQLCERISKVNPSCFYIPNAADFKHFNRATRLMKRPPEIKNLKNPIIGFIGAIWDWINIDLICKLAESHKDYSILLVGPVYYGLSDLQKHSNIFLVGTKKYDFLPQYLSCMDVCLIPFKINELTLASSPIKMYEYLAAGKPVVSTALPEVCENASQVVMIAKDDDDFIKKVEEAVNDMKKPRNERTILRRINFAESNSWEKQVERIEHLLAGITRLTVS